MLLHCGSQSSLRHAKKDLRNNEKGRFRCLLSVEIPRQEQLKKRKAQGYEIANFSDSEMSWGGL
jgi:hypothetical protein